MYDTTTNLYSIGTHRNVVLFTILTMTHHYHVTYRVAPDVSSMPLPILPDTTMKMRYFLPEVDTETMTEHYTEPRPSLIHSAVDF